MVASARRWALMHEHARRAPSRRLDELVAHMSPVDLLLVEGFKRDPHPKLEVHRPVARQAAALSRRSAYRRDRLGRAASRRRCRCCRSTMPRPIADFIVDHARVRRMAQLSDDCFAFGGALMRRRAALALIAQRIAPVVEAETVPLGRGCGPHSGARSRRRHATCRRTTTAAVDGYAVAHADLAPDRDTVLPVERPRRRRPSARPRRPSAARRSASSPARRCPRAPTRC